MAPSPVYSSDFLDAALRRKSMCGLAEILPQNTLKRRFLLLDLKTANDLIVTGDTLQYHVD